MAKSNRDNLRQRIFSALVMAPLALLATYLGGWIYALAVTLAAALGLREWVRLTGRGLPWAVFGILYLGSFGCAMLYLRELPGGGAAMIYFLLACILGADIGAYAAGRLIGGPKLAPVISPSKTWAGLLGGMALAGLFGYAAAACLGAQYPQTALALAIVLAVVAQIGDLFESWIKRRAGKKESGKFPGHGGVLDRIDGLIFAAIFLALINGLWVAFTMTEIMHE